MPKSNKIRNGKVRRKRRGDTSPTIRCRFCNQKKSAGHKPGCTGGLMDAHLGHATTLVYKMRGVHV